MDLTQVLLALLTAITTVSYADTHRRLGRVERDLSEVKVQLAAKPDRSELLAIHEDLSRRPDRDEIGLGTTSILEELRKKPDRAEFDSLRGDVGALRTDLTHIALAVGAERPRKVE